MEKSQIIFNSKKSLDDFELYIENVEVEFPRSRVIQNNVPYQNGYYDFSEVYGDLSYDNRKITITFKFENRTIERRTQINSKYGAIAEWLLGSGESKLYIEYEYGYFLAWATNITPIELSELTGKITVEFDCYPFRSFDEAEGNDIWDIFNFELDYAFQTTFVVQGELDITLYNSSAIKKTPTIKSTGNISVIHNNVIYNITPGTWHDWRIALNKGANKLKLKGTGNIDFIYYKEVI